MTQVPPSRFKVIEQGRRLVVVDTRSGADRPDRAAPAGQSSHKAVLPSLPRRARFDGTAELTTHPLYDAKGPRTITLDAATARMVRWAAGGIAAIVALWVVLIFFHLWLVVAPLALLKESTRTALRARTTRLIDQLATRSSAG